MRYLFIIFGIILIIYACTKEDYLVELIKSNKTIKQNERKYMTKTTPKGIYAVANYINKTQEDAILQNPNIKGFFIRLGWSTVNPSENIYDWKLLDEDIDNAIKYNKKVSIAIVAGEYSPVWLETYDKFIDFKVSNHQGKGKTNDISIPAPYNAVVLTNYMTMLIEMQKHLLTTNRYETVEFVKLCGINQSTAETRLPYQFDAVDQWMNNGYTFSKIKTSWITLVELNKILFPDKYISMAIIGDPNAFPNIDENGKEVTDKENKGTEILITDLLQNYSSDMIVQFNAVTETGGTPLDIISDKVIVGYQEQVSGTKSDQYVVNVAQNVVNHNGKFLELFNKTIKSFPKGVEDASKLFN